MIREHHLAAAGLCHYNDIALLLLFLISKILVTRTQQVR